MFHTLPKGGMYREIHPPRTERFPEGGDPNTLPRKQGVYWIICSLEIISFDIGLVRFPNSQEGRGT